MLEHLKTLSPEGETLLVVKQTPTGSWPAFLPDKKMRPGAWYVNTASFILSRMGDKISASAINATHCLFMVLDDIGTKSKTPSLAPTWIMETSPGNYQWGYIFTEQPTTGEFAAAIKAIAAAGYTDPGATNPVRNVRLPGSINLKPGRESFASKLVEWHPEREFTLAQICAALDVTPGEAEAMHRPIGLQDDGEDEVLAWVAERGELLEQPNGAGWAGVLCPNHAEHSDGNLVGRYNPVNRAYKCMHGHCQDWDSAKYLDWVAAQGGPKVAYGLREALLADIMAGALSKLTPSTMFTDDAAAAIRDVEDKNLGRVQKAEWYDRFAYIQDDDGYFDMQDRRQLSRGTFNALYRHVPCKSIHTERRCEPSVCYDENRQAKGAHALVGVTYAAGESVLVARDGLVYGNRWVDARIEPAPGDVSLWLEHLELIVPEAFEREHLLDVMACKLQHPNVKINHAVLLAGGHGAGKDTLLAPWITAVCGKAHKNKSLVSAKTLESAFNYCAEAEIMIINELRPDEFKDRRALENTLKPIIAAPPEYITVNRKGLHPYDALNRVLVVAFSNFRDAIALPPDDRRWFVIWTYATHLAESKAERLWAWYAHSGYEAVAAHLMSRDVSAFNPAAAPPMTEAKQIMSQQSMSAGESYIYELIQSRKGEFALGVIGSPFQALVDRLSGGAPCKITLAALNHALAEAGWFDVGRVKSRANDTKKQIFAAPDMMQKSRSEMRDMLETAPMPTLQLVKGLG